MPKVQARMASVAHEASWVLSEVVGMLHLDQVGNAMTKPFCANCGAAARCEKHPGTNLLCPACQGERRSEKKRKANVLNAQKRWAKDVLYSYSRQQAIEDGVLIDLNQASMDEVCLQQDTTRDRTTLRTLPGP